MVKSARPGQAPRGQRRRRRAEPLWGKPVTPVQKLDQCEQRSVVGSAGGAGGERLLALPR